MFVFFIMKNRKLAISFTIFSSAYLMMAVIKLSSTIVMPVFQARFNMTSSLVGLVSGAFFLTYAFMQIITGPLCNRFGAYKVMGTGLVITVGGCMLFALAKSPSYLLIGRLLLGLGLGPVYLCNVYFIQCNYTGHDYAKKMGLAIMITCMGSALSGQPLSILINALGPEGTFTSFSILFAVILVLSVIMGRDETVSSEKRSSVLRQLQESFVIIGKSYTVRACMLLWALYNVSMTVYQGLWSATWFSASYPRYATLAGLCSTVLSLGHVVSSPISERMLSGKVSRERSLVRLAFIEIGTLVLLCASKCLYVFGESPLFVLVSFVSDFAFGFTTGHLCIQISATMRENTDVLHNATIMGLANFMSSLLIQVMQYLTGVTIDIFSAGMNLRNAITYTYMYVILLYIIGVLYSRRIGGKERS